MTPPHRMLVLAGAVAVCLLCGGCPVVSYLVATLAPPPEVKAVYELPKDKTVLVFPDDKANPVSYPPLKRMLAEKLNAQLGEHKLAAQTLPYDRLLDLQSRGGDFDRLPIDQIGIKTGAGLVLYVELVDFRLRDDEAAPMLWHGQLKTRVRVVDPAQGRLWPKDGSQGYDVSIDTPLAENGSDAYGTTLTETLADKIADKVAKLFYTHRGPPNGSDPKYQ